MKKENGVLKGVSEQDLKLLNSNPEEFWEGVTEIGTLAFAYLDRLTSITIPSGVTAIGNLAFAECPHLSRVTIPNTVTSIGYAAFSYCPGLEEITLPDGVQLSSFVFEVSGLIRITIPDSVKSLGQGAFLWCNHLKSATIPEHLLSSIKEDLVFKGCPLEHLYVKGKDGAMRDVMEETQSKGVTPTETHKPGVTTKTTDGRGGM